jgi:hypothetical protein
MGTEPYRTSKRCISVRLSLRGIDVAKLRNTVATADVGRDGEIQDQQMQRVAQAAILARPPPVLAASGRSDAPIGCFGHKHTLLLGECYEGNPIDQI